MHNHAGNTSEDGAIRRDARNEAFRRYIRIVLLGGEEVVAAARRMMIFIDSVTYLGNTFGPLAYDEVLVAFQDAPDFDLTGQRDLASIIAEVHWPIPRSGVRH